MKMFTIELSNETVEKINKIVTFYNLKNELKHIDLPVGDIETFITGCVNDYIHQIETYHDMSGYNNLGKPFQLKNRFKEIFKEQGLKNKEISELTGINESNLSTAFKNKNQLSLDYFLRLWVLAECPPINEVLYRESN